MPTYTWVGTTSDWGTNTNWNPTTSAAGVGPTAGDTVIFNNTSNAACTTGTAARTCLTLTTTGYTGTLTIGSSTVGTLTVTSNVTIGNHTIAGVANLIMTGTATLNSGSTIPNFSPNPGTSLLQAITLSGNTTITNFSKGGSGNVTFNAASSVLLNITNGSILTSFGSFIMGTNVTLTIVGSSSIGSINFTGAMNVSSGATLTLTANLFLATSGSTPPTTFNCSLGTFVPGLNTVTVSSGTTLNMGSTNSFYNLSGAASTVTMASNIRVTNNFTLSLINNYNGAFDITVGGNLNVVQINNTSPSRKIIMTGLSTGSATITNSTIGNNYTLEIDCGNRPVTFTGSTTLSGGGINYLNSNSGTFTTTGHILNYNNGTINMNNSASSTRSWNIIANGSGAARTLTLLSNVFCQTLGNSAYATGTTFNDTFTSIGGTWYLGILGNAELIRATNASSNLEWRFIGNTNATITLTNPADIFNINITTDKTAGTVTFPAAFIWGGTSRTLNLNSTANFATNSTTLTLSGTPLTILNASGSQFYNLTTGTGFTSTPQTINLN